MGVPLPQRLLERYKKLVVARHDYMLAQAQRLNEMQKYQNRRRFVQESFEALVDTFSAQTEEGLRVTAAGSFEGLKGQLLQDWHDLRQQSSVTADIEQAASSKQYSINEAERKFMQSLRAFVKRLPQGDSFAAALAEIEQASGIGNQSTKASNDIPELVQTYFDRRGDMALIMEQIGDLEHMYNDEKGARDFRRDQEVEPPTSDDEFHEAFETEYNALLGRLEVLKKDVEDMRTQCMESGIDVEAYRFKQNRSQSATSSSSSFAFVDDEQGEIFTLRPSNLENLLSDMRDAPIGFLGEGQGATADSVLESHPEADQNSVERWLTGLNGISTDPPVINDSQIAHVEPFSFATTRQQEIRAKIRIQGKRRRSDSAIFGDFFHEAQGGI
ncbi:hypothetical protein M409DRAFT_29825 [Zasmidium cellare ATCC 36951]|uniref:Uncharacterized protein n=1 Tax=Zasmidium cellare ATCC 36951 TaxID=1080233 RepID=A0A6A6C075_ZASCE|nr:uncharacterized protein M409DRAFT_29825 [Zasmidium cellare ATCC 36951]KAF2159658.1 hypothetical protein M409DRAFT_29825 [Zasmidium cellare ATCC 36951]